MFVYGVQLCESLKSFQEKNRYTIMCTNYEKKNVFKEVLRREIQGLKVYPVDGS